MGKKITSLTKLKAQVALIESGYSRRRAVKNIIDGSGAPVGPEEFDGNRFILDILGGSIDPAWDGANEGDIVEFDGTVWVATTPLEGYTAYVDQLNKDALYVDDGVPEWELRDTSVADSQALVSFRKVAPQVVSTLSGEADNIITFSVANPMPTAPSILDFDGTILEVKQRHPLKLSPLTINFVLSNSHNAGVSVTVILRVSVDGGATYPVIANTETFNVLPKSGSTDSSAFPYIGEWVSPQPSLVSVFLKVQVFASVAAVVSVNSGSVFNLNGVYK